MPFIINRMGDFFDWYEWISIKQKIPLRLYVGIEKFEGNSFFSEIIVFDHEDKLFKKLNWESIPYLSNILEYINQIKWATNMKISILSEIPKNYGMGFNAILCSLIDIITEINSKGVQADEIIKASKSKEINKIIYETDIGEKIRNKKKLLPSMGKIWLTSILTSFFSWSNIFIWWRKSSVDGVRFFTNKLGDFLQEEKQLHIDTTLIYSWTPSCLELFNYQYNDNINRDELTPIFNRITQIIENNTWDNLRGILQKVQNNNTKSNEISNSMISILSIELLIKMIKSVENIHDDNNQSELISTMNKIRFANLATKKINQRTQHRINQLAIECGGNINDIALNTNDPIITWWTILLNSKYDIFRKKIKLAIQNNKLTEFYSSFNDGQEEDWIKVEKNWKIEKDYIIILNKITGKITHNIDKELVTRIISQQWTVDLFSKFLDKKSNQLSNRELVKSSYSSSKSEMNNKIIKPFIKYCDELFGKWSMKIKLEWSANYFSISYESNIQLKIINE